MPWHTSLGDDGFIFLTTADLPNPRMTAAEKTEELEAANQLIKAKYDAGVPFFTKDVFRDVIQQLESETNLGRSVSITGLDGFAVHFPIETGTSHPDLQFEDDEDIICVLTTPQLLYHTVDHLLAVQDPNEYSVCRAYLPVELAHSIELWNRQHNVTVSLWPALDYAATKLRFTHAKQSLEASEEFSQLKSAFASVAIPPGIDKIVAFACSTMTWAATEDHRAGRSMAQHTLALTVRDHLANGYGKDANDIKCYAQDPIYMAEDKTVLAEAGFTVVNDPRGFLHVDNASVVISVSPDIPVRQIIADIARPAILIWNRVNGSTPDTERLCADPESPRLRRMMEEYNEVPFPAQPHFGDVAIYVKKGYGKGG